MKERNRLIRRKFTLHFWQGLLVVLYTLAIMTLVSSFARPVYNSALGGVFIRFLVFVLPVLVFAWGRCVSLTNVAPLSGDFRLTPLCCGFNVALFLFFNGLLTLTSYGPWMRTAEFFFKTHSSVHYIFMAVIVTPIFEEIFFRGLLLRGFLPKYGFLKSTVFTSLLFGLVHLSFLDNPLRFVSAFMSSSLLCFVAVKTRNILPPILCHSMFNAMAFIAPVVLLKMGFNAGSQTSLVYASGLSIAIGGFFIIMLGSRLYPEAKRLAQDDKAEH
jgi:membrane protease YdiL (CAAX protease family)